MLHGEIERGAVSAGLAAGHNFLKHCHADSSTPPGKSRRYQKMLVSGKLGLSFLKGRGLGTAYQSPTKQKRLNRCDPAA
jgi:hypothetical protein